MLYLTMIAGRAIILVVMIRVRISMENDIYMYMYISMCIYFFMYFYSRYVFCTNWTALNDLSNLTQKQWFRWKAVMTCKVSRQRDWSPLHLKPSILFIIPRQEDSRRLIFGDKGLGWGNVLRQGLIPENYVKISLTGA